MAPVFSAKELSLHYRTRFGEEIHAVSGVSFELEEGEVLGIAGESGCGKSTLASGCMGLFLPPLHHTAGEITLGGRSLVGLSPQTLRSAVLGEEVAMIPQGALGSLNPTRRVEKLARDVMRSHRPGMKNRDIRRLLEERFELIGLDPDRVLRAHACELSGGMRQRVVIGISTLLDPRLVIADEPTSALDVSTQRAVIEMILGLLDRGIVGSMLFITHELPLLRHVATKVAVMYAGEIVEYGATEQVLLRPAHPYTRALMDAMLLAEVEADGHRPRALEGAPPKLHAPPPGCRFAPRCPVAQPDCAGTRQSMVDVDGRRVRCMHAR